MKDKIINQILVFYGLTRAEYNSIVEYDITSNTDLLNRMTDFDNSKEVWDGIDKVLGVGC